MDAHEQPGDDGAPEPDALDAVSAVRPATKPPGTPPFAAVLAVLACIGACLVVVCTAGAFGTLHAALGSQEKSTQREVERLTRGLEELAALAATLDGLEAYLLSLHADAFSFPEELPELAPNDPWGRRIRYVRLDADRAILESDGPDRREDSADDVARAVDAR